MLNRSFEAMNAIAYTCLLSILAPRKRDDRGAAAVEWLIVIGAAVGIAYFAGDSVLNFAKGLAGKLGGR